MSKFSDAVGQGKVLVDFYAEWCGPCKVLSPVLQELSREWGDRVRVIKIDVDKNPAIAQKLAIQGVPTLMFFVEGKSVWRKSGALPKHQIMQELQSFL